MEKTPLIEASWLEVLSDEFKKDYFVNIKENIVKDIEAGMTLYPPMSKIFNAFSFTPFDQVTVVILGQDPYHGPLQAHGLSFSVPEGVMSPPSLKNIFKEIQSDVGGNIPASGNLESWSKQGVLLLNAILTVQKGIPASHSKIGWEIFTDAVIKTISDKKSGVVFLLWGNFARSKKVLIDASKHFVLEAPHPSPFSAHSGFFGCKHFSKINEILRQQGTSEIVWM